MIRPETWKRIEEVFHRALEVEPRAREAFLEAACAGDPELHVEVARLLARDESPAPLLSEGVFSLGEDLVLGGSSSRRMSALRIGSRLGPYKVTELIAAGGMGLVYQAERVDEAFAMTVAIKILPWTLKSAPNQRQFAQERQTLANLVHPNIARIMDGGTSEDGLPYLVMEYVDGVPVDEYCDANALGTDARLRIFIEVCKTVHFFHQNLVVHQDLKPNNILVTREGRTKILDFGIAKLVGPHPETGDRDSGQLALTPGYASPEQLAGTVVTTASDIYSLGVVLFRLLTGAALRPLGGAGNSTNQSEQTDALPRDLDRILWKSLEPRPEDRYRSAEQFAEDLERFLGGLPVRAQPDSIAYRFRCFARRNRWELAAGVVAIALLVVATIVSLWSAAVARTKQAQYQAASRRAAAEVAHVRIESTSAGQVASFLIDVYLASLSPGDAREKERSLSMILARAAQFRRQYAEQPHMRANLLDALGRACLSLGILEDAESLVVEAWNVRLEEFGAESLEVALSLQTLGHLRLAQGRLTEAKEQFEQVLHLQEACPPGAHTDIGTAANNYAVTLRRLGDGEGARRYHERALEWRVQQFGETSPEVAESLNNLAALERDSGQLDLAEQTMRRALQIRRDLFGEDDLMTLQCQSNLGVLLLSMERTEEALACFDETIERYRTLKALGHEGLCRTLSHAGVVRISKGEVAAGGELLREALDLRERVYGPDDPERATILSELGRLAGRAGQIDEARVAHAEAVRIRRADPSGAARPLGIALQAWGAFLIEQREFESALPLLEEAADILEDELTSPHALLASLRASLGLCFEGLGEDEDAERWLLEALEAIPVTEQRSARRRFVRQKLAALYERTGRPEAAESYRRD